MIKFFESIRKWFVASKEDFTKEVCNKCDMSEKKCCKRDLSCAKNLNTINCCKNKGNSCSTSCCKMDLVSDSSRSCKRSSKCGEQFSLSCKKSGVVDEVAITVDAEEAEKSAIKLAALKKEMAESKANKAKQKKKSGGPAKSKKANAQKSSKKGKR